MNTPVRLSQKGGREYDEEEVLRECYLMKKCTGQHDGLINFMNLYETKKTFELVMEHCHILIPLLKAKKQVEQKQPGRLEALHLPA